ncbi:MAG: restriction endonuclease, partial [Prosthecobacter sp.]|nr:restriction endonuclease [Prosthecobacter sp.]
MNTSLTGDVLERRIYDLLQAEIDAGRFWAKKANCKLFWKKGYFSKDRNTEIIFDVAIEIYLPDATEYSCLVLIECKNFARNVSVGVAEEFFARVQQVAAANSKAILATTSAFQTGTLEFARSKGIGLLRYFDPGELKWELKR